MKKIIKYLIIVAVLLLGLLTIVNASLDALILNFWKDETILTTDWYVKLKSILGVVSGSTFAACLFFIGKYMTFLFNTENLGKDVKRKNVYAIKSSIAIIQSQNTILVALRDIANYQKALAKKSPFISSLPNLKVDNIISDQVVINQSMILTLQADLKESSRRLDIPVVEKIININADIDELKRRYANTESSFNRADIQMRIIHLEKERSILHKSNRKQIKLLNNIIVNYNKMSTENQQSIFIKLGGK